MIEQVEHDSPHRSEVLGGIARTSLIRIFSKARVELPVAVVFNLPMRPNRLPKLLGIRWQAAQIVALFKPSSMTAGFLDRLILHDDEALQSTPFGPNTRVHPIKAICRHDATQGLAPMVCFVILVDTPTGCFLKFEMTQRDVKMINRFLVQRLLVSLQGKEIVRLLRDDGLGKSSLCSHRIDGDGVTFEIELGEDFLDGPNLVLLFGNVVLAKGEALLGGPCTDDVNGTLLGGVTAAQTLAIDGDNFITERCADGSKVGAEAVVEMIGIDHRKDVGKGLRGGNAMRNFNPLAEPIELEFAEIFDLSEIIHAAQSRGDDHEEDFSEVVLFVISGAWIFEDLERFKAIGKTAGVVDFVRIARHLKRMTPLDIAYQPFKALPVVSSLA